MTNNGIKITMVDFGRKTIKVKSSDPKKAKSMFDNMFKEKFK